MRRGPRDPLRSDLALGLEKRTPWPRLEDPRDPAFEALPGPLRERLSAYLDGGGALVVSGAHWVSDADADPASAAWVRATLGLEADGTAEATALAGDGLDVPFRTAYGPEGYAVRSPDRLAAAAPGAAPVLTFRGGGVAAVARGRTVGLSVPLEAVPDEAQRAALLEAALRRALGG